MPISNRGCLDILLNLRFAKRQWLMRGGSPEGALGYDQDIKTYQRQLAFRRQVREPRAKTKLMRNYPGIFTLYVWQKDLDLPWVPAMHVAASSADEARTKMASLFEQAILNSPLEA